MSQHLILLLVKQKFPHISYRNKESAAHRDKATAPCDPAEGVCVRASCLSEDQRAPGLIEFVSSGVPVCDQQGAAGLSEDTRSAQVSRF